MAFFDKVLKIQDSMRPMCSVVVPAAGTSARMGGENKLFMELDGVPVLVRTLQAIDQAELVDEIIVAAEDEKKMTIYRLKLSDVKAARLPIASKDDDDEYMDENKDPEEELTETPEYPSNLDPVLREALHIVKDMVDMP